MFVAEHFRDSIRPMWKVTIRWRSHHGWLHVVQLDCETWGEALAYQRIPRLRGWATVEFLPE